MLLQVNLFGHFEVWREGQLIETWPRQKTQALLQLLLSERGRTFSQDQLIEIFFPRRDPQKAINNLQKRVSELRRVLEPNLNRGANSHFILSSGSHEQGYCFNPNAACHIDLEVFDKSIQLAQAASASERWTQAIEHYSQAIALYRDDFLCDSRYEEWTIALRERWREKFLQALTHLAESHARLGQLLSAIECCDQVLKHQPWSEPIYRKKMLYSYHSANRAKALETFKECSAMLEKHLDAAPSPETVVLQEQILKYQVPPLPRTIPNNLPQSLTSFVGREREMIELNQLLMNTRLLTLAGVGGCGKTRLALQVATQHLREFADGVWWVELASLSDPNLVVQALASAMGVQEQAKKALVSTVCEFLQAKHTLVVLDNGEHLLGACAGLAQELLKACPRLQIVATSREPLGILGERVWQVPSLSVPPLNAEQLSAEALREYEAAQLFEERARANEAQFEITKENAGAIKQICSHLDGLPLALELAAARVRALSVQQIAARLDDRFKLLTGGNRGSLPRHQTLQAAMEWSYQLLTEQEQGLLRRLSVFAGGWTLEAAEQICADEFIHSEEVMELLVHLVDKSLVIAEKGKEETRYKLLETVRQYASEKLSEGDETEKVQERHLDYFLKLAEEAEPELVGPKQKEWLDRLEREHDNLRGAIKQNKNQNVKRVELVIALATFWEMRGYLAEGIIFKDLHFKSESLCKELQARISRKCGWFLHRLGDNDQAKKNLKISVDLYLELNDKQEIGYSMNYLGMILLRQGDLAAAQNLFEQSLDIMNKVRDQYGISVSLNNLGILATSRCNYLLALQYLEQCLEINKKIGNARGISQSFFNLGIVLRNQGNYALAKEYFEQALATNQMMGDQPIVVDPWDWTET